MELGQRTTAQVATASLLDLRVAPAVGSPVGQLT